MKRYILMILLLIPLISYAEIPAVVKLGKEAAKQEDVEHTSVGSFMLGMASKFADKEQRATFKMLDNIEMIECKNRAYAPKLVAQTLAIIENEGATFIGSQDDGKALNELYGVYSGDVIKELIIIVKSHTEGVAIVAMSGTIPTHRLAEIATIKR